MRNLGTLHHAVALTLLLATTTLHAQDTVVVRRVLSGTSIELESGAKVSLLGVGTARSKVLDPEIARDHLAAIVEGRAVVLVDDADQKPTAGKRMRSCYLYFDGSLINLELIEDGYCAATTTRHSRLAEFQSAEKSARSQALAAWSEESHLSVRCNGTARGRRCTALTRHVSGRCEGHRRR